MEEKHMGKYQELAKEIVNVWLTTPFSNGERHKNRIEKVMAIEKL